MWWPIFFLLLLGACSCGGEKVPSTIAILGGSRPAGVGCYDDSSGAALWECAWPAQLKGVLPNFSIINRAYPLGSPLHTYYTWGLALDPLTETPDMLIFDFHPHHWLKIGKYQKKALMALIKHLEKFPDIMVIALVSPLPPHLNPEGGRVHNTGAKGFDGWVEGKENAWLERKGVDGEWVEGKDWIWWFYENSFFHLVEVSPHATPLEIAQRVGFKVKNCFTTPSSCKNHLPPPNFPYEHHFNFKDISFPPTPSNLFPTDHLFPFTKKLSIFRKMSEKIWLGPPLMFKFMIRPHLSIQEHVPRFGYNDGSAILRGELPTRYLGKLTGVDSYLWEKLTEIPRGTIPLEEWEEKWDEENGKGEEKWRETCETPREGVVPTYTEMGGVELDLSENGMREEWKGEKGEDVGAHVCVQIKRLSHPCDCLGNVDKDGFVMHTYDPVDNADYQEKQKFTNMMYVSNLKQGGTAPDVPTYVMPHWHTNFENQIHERPPPEEKLKVHFAGEQKYSSLSKHIRNTHPEFLEKGDFGYEFYPKKNLSNSWELQRQLHKNANEPDIIIVSRYSKERGKKSFKMWEAYFHSVVYKPALRMFNAWSHRQAVIFANEWSYFEFSKLWFGQIPSIMWNVEFLIDTIEQMLNNRTLVEKMGNTGYSVSPLFGDSLIHHYPLSVCHNWKKMRKEKGVVGDRMSLACEYLDELLEYTNPHTPQAWTHEVFAPGGPIFGEVDFEEDDLAKVLEDREKSND